MSFAIKFDLAELSAQLDADAAAVEAAARPAAQAGAQILYDRTKANAPRTLKDHWFYGSQFRKTGKRYRIKAGTLQRSIYQVFSKDNSNPGDAVYHIAWNQKEAPHGFMVEYGTRKAPAHSFLRAAYASHSAIAEQAIETRFFEELQKAGVTR